MNDQINPTMIIVGNLKGPLSQRDRLVKQKSTNIPRINHTIEQMDLINIYRMFYLITTKYKFFSEAHRTVSKTDHITFTKPA